MLSGSSERSSSPGRWTFVSEASVLVLRPSSICQFWFWCLFPRVFFVWRVEVSLLKESSGVFPLLLERSALASSFFSVQAPFATQTVSFPFHRQREPFSPFLVQLQLLSLLFRLKLPVWAVLVRLIYYPRLVRVFLFCRVRCLFRWTAV